MFLSAGISALQPEAVTLTRIRRCGRENLPLLCSIVHPQPFNFQPAQARRGTLSR